MPDELARAFTALSSDSERGLLLTGPELRYQAARRRSRRAGATTAATAALVALAIGTGWTLTGDGGRGSAAPPAGSAAGPAPSASVAPSLAPSSSPSPPPSSRPPSAAATSSEPPPAEPSSPAPTTEPVVVPETIPAEIPSRVLLAQADANATVTEFRPLGVPEFCPAATFASQKQLGVSASRVSRYRKPDTPDGNIPDDGVYHTVGVYRGDGARDYLADLRRAAGLCATSRIRGLDARFGLLTPLGVGDESVLIERSYEDVDAEGRPLDNGRWRNTYVAAVRVGDTVTLIDCRGYENASSDVTTARTLGQALAKRLQAWRG